jgi:hypothetical protein
VSCDGIIPWFASSYPELQQGTIKVSFGALMVSYSSEIDSGVGRGKAAEISMDRVNNPSRRDADGRRYCYD